MKIDLEQWKFFNEFCKYEQLTGGPGPHVRTAVKLCEGLPVKEQLWRAALYVGVYNIPTAEAIWRNNPIGNVGLKWLEEHWKGGIRLRKERRTVNTPAKLFKYLSGYPLTLKGLPPLQRASFEEVWKFANSLPHVGRYAAARLVEMWHRLGITKAGHFDIRAKGGWSPRETLQLLVPSYTTDKRADDVKSVQQAEALAKIIFSHIKIKLSMFEFGEMLCEYRSSYVGRRQYPGRSLDSELKYEMAIKDYWKFGKTEHMKVRKTLFPVWALGENNGWSGARDELGPVVSSYGYTWTDSLYIYGKTTDFSNPVRK